MAGVLPDPSIPYFGIPEDILFENNILFLFPMQERREHFYVRDLCMRAERGMDNTAGCINSYVAFHPKVVLVALLCVPHLVKGALAPPSESSRSEVSPVLPKAVQQLR